MRAPPEDRRKVWVLALVALLYTLVLANLLNQTDLIRLNSDFLSRWYATDKLLSEGHNLYDSQNGVEVVAYSGAANDPTVGYFYYPAHILFLLMPFGLLSYHAALFLWVFAGQVFFFLGTWLAHGVWAVYLPDRGGLQSGCAAGHAGLIYAPVSRTAYQR